LRECFLGPHSAWLFFGAHGSPFSGDGCILVLHGSFLSLRRLLSFVLRSKLRAPTVLARCTCRRMYGVVRCFGPARVGGCVCIHAFIRAARSWHTQEMRFGGILNKAHWPCCSQEAIVELLRRFPFRPLVCTSVAVKRSVRTLNRF